MPDLFISAPGTVARSSLKTSVTTGLITIDGFNIDDKTSFPALIMKIDVSLKTAQTWTRSLGDNLFVMPHGDQPTNISLELLIMPESSNCKNAKIAPSLGKILKLYLDNRIKKNKITPISITFADTVIKGFITECSISISSQGVINTATAMLSIMGWLTEDFT